jgi:Ca2+/Na+ antiporter
MISTSATDLRRHALRSAALGGLAWVVCVPLLWPRQDDEARTLAGLLLLLAPLALVPLALSLLVTAAHRWRIAVWTQLPAALFLVGAFVYPAGPTAGLLALPWLLFTMLIAACGLMRIREHALTDVAEWTIDAGLIYLAVGGLWTIASRSGRALMGFGEPIVQLTGAHFHYAGLLLPVLTGLAARTLGGPLARLAAVAVIIGVPSVAVGITLSAQGIHLPEMVAALWMSAAGFVVGFPQFRMAKRASSILTRGLFVISGVSLIAGMALAAVYAVGDFTYVMQWRGEGVWLSIPQMVRYHAAINVFGFALSGLLAWLMLRIEPSRKE